MSRDFGKKDLGDIYKQLFDSAGEGLIISNSKGEIILANPSAHSIFGYSSNDPLVGKKIEELIPDSIKSKHKEHRRNYNQNPSKRTMGAGLTLYAKKKNGQNIPVEISLNHFKRGQDLFIMAMITDITIKYKLDKQLIKEKETAQTYLDVASTIFLVLDKEGKIRLLNKKGESLFGVREKDVIGSSWLDTFTFEEDKEKARRFFRHAFNATESRKSYTEFRVKSKRRGLRIISWNYSVVENERNELKTVIFSGQDITERVEAEEKLKIYNTELEKIVENRTKELSAAVENLANVNKKLELQNRKIRHAQELLEESQKLYKIIARNFPKGTISVFDENLNYIFVEGKELYELGVTSEMLIGTNLIDRLSPEIREETEKALMEVFDGEAKKIEVKQRENYYVLNAVPLKDNRGKVNQIMVVEQNVTESKLAEENIRKALKKERDLGELKTRFVSMASHEFRTPLSTILSSISLIKKYVENGSKEKTQKHIDRVKSSVANLTNILNDFLSLGRLEEGKVAVNLELINIEEFSLDLSEEMQSQAKSGQVIHYKHEGSPDFVIDRGIFRNVVTNLLSNALKYSGTDKKVDFSTKRENDNLKISVSDQGIGIPEVEQKYLFERFFRAKNASNIQGTGLGLNIVKKYVELLGGDISFTSGEKEGTKFTIIFDQKLIEETTETVL